MFSKLTPRQSIVEELQEEEEENDKELASINRVEALTILQKDTESTETDSGKVVDVSKISNIRSTESCLSSA